MRNAALQVRADPYLDEEAGSAAFADRPDGAIVSPTAPVDAIGLRLLRLLCTLGKARQAQFTGPLATQPCWDVLLQLYMAHLNQHRLSIGDVTKRTGVPGTSVLRAIQALQAAGLLNRTEDWYDRRRVFVELSQEGVDAMTRYIQTGSRAASL